MLEGLSGADRRRLAGLVAVGFLLRIGVVAVFQAWNRPPDWNFAGELGAIAKALAEGQGWANPFDVESGPTAWHPPGWTGLMALVFSVFGIRTPASAFTMQLILSAASALTAVPLFLLGRRIFGVTAAWAGAALWGVYPNAVWYVMTSVESAAGVPLLILTLLYQLDCLNDEKPISSYIKYGALLGGFALFRVTLLGLAPGIAAVLWFRSRLPLQDRAWRLALLGGTAALMLSPWILRNWVVMGKPGLRSNLGVELRIANSELRWRAFRDPSAEQNRFLLHPSGSKKELDRYREVGETAYVSEAMADFRSHFAAHPGRMAELTAYRVAAFWFGHFRRPGAEYEGNLNTGLSLNVLKRIWAPAASILGFIGIYLAWRRRLPISAAVIAPILLPLPYYFTNVFGRYRIEVDSAMVLFGGYVAAELFLMALPPAWRGAVQPPPQPAPETANR